MAIEEGRRRERKCLPISKAHAARKEVREDRFYRNQSRVQLGANGVSHGAAWRGGVTCRSINVIIFAARPKCEMARKKSAIMTPEGGGIEPCIE